MSDTNANANIEANANANANTEDNAPDSPIPPTPPSPRLPPLNVHWSDEDLLENSISHLSLMPEVPQIRPIFVRLGPNMDNNSNSNSNATPLLIVPSEGARSR